FSGDVKHLAPSHRAVARDGMPERGRAIGHESAHPPRVGDLLRGDAPDVLERAYPLAAWSGLCEILRVVAADQLSQVRGEMPDLDLCLRRALAPNQVEEQRHADVIKVLEARSVDD